MNVEKDLKQSENPNLNIAGNSGSILINYNNKYKNKYIISSKHPLFKNEYIKVSVNNYRLVFSLPTIDYIGKMYKSNINNHSSNWRYFSITNELLITGKFEIDTEESNEDELIVYYR